MSKAFYDELWTNNTFNFSPSKLIRERWILFLLKKYLPKKEEWSFLDLGCGRGSLLRKVAKAFSTSHLSGADYSDAAIAYNSAEQPNVQFKVFDFQEKGISSSFKELNCVVSQEVIEHLSPDLHVQFLIEIRTMLAANGLAIITTPDWDSIQGLRNAGEEDGEFAHRFESQPNAHILTQRQLQELANQAGFDVVWHQTVCPYMRNRKLSNLLAMSLFLMPKFFEMFLLENGLRKGKYQIAVLKKRNV